MLNNPSSTKTVQHLKQQIQLSSEGYTNKMGATAIRGEAGYTGSNTDYLEYLLYIVAHCRNNSGVTTTYHFRNTGRDILHEVIIYIKCRQSRPVSIYGLQTSYT